MGQGTGGSVIINAGDRVSLDSSAIFSNVGGADRSTVAVGQGGNIEITSPSLSLVNGAQLQSVTFGQGDAGNVVINAGDRVSLDSSAIFSTVERSENAIGAGNGGEIRITTGSLFMTDGAQLAADTLGRGDAGNVILNARDRATFDDSSITSRVNQDGEGSGGNIDITAGSLFLTDRALLATITLGQGDAGDVIINVRDRAVFDNAAVLSNNLTSLTESNGGDIRITTGSLFLTSTQFVAETLGRGDAGDVTIRARDRVALNDSTIFSTVGNLDANAIAVGEGGNIEITTSSLSLTSRTQLSASTFGQGDAGNVIINARDRIALNDSTIFSTVGGANASDVNQAVVGNGGRIEIATGSFSLLNGAQLQTITFDQGNAGSVIINARDRVLIEGTSRPDATTAILTSTARNSQGRGGPVRITADSIRLTDAAVIGAETQNRFSGGTVILNGNIIEVEGSAVTTSTSDKGAAGTIILNAADRVTLSGDTSNNGLTRGTGSGLSASTERNSSGQGGTIRITTNQLQVSDLARVTVDSQGGGIAGNVNITASTVQLDQGRLTAETAAVNGGNITLRDLDLLQLSNDSLISTTAGTDRAGGNGGNIDINADFILSLPNNSDIRTNAFSGSGGNVSITTEGLFGIAAQAQDNPLTSDITASSQQGVQGTVDITTPDVDPRRGLTELPVEVVDASNQITQTCSGQGREETSAFVVTGRGGLPSSPIDPLTGEDSSADWAALDEEAPAIAPPNQAPDRAAAVPIVEAQGWVVGQDGAVRLIANAPASALQPPEACHRPKNE